MSALSDAAAFLAPTWPVFACNAIKRPITPNGFYDAVSDPAEAREMFSKPGAATIGVPTGPASNLAVVDLDVKEGRAGLEWLAANEHRLPRTRRHRTMSGGIHLLFNYPAGRRIRNSASKHAPGVDVRGEGGYIVVPPSPGYSITDDAMPADMPAWLVELLDPPKPAIPALDPLQRRATAAGDGTPYGLAGLDRECAAIRGAADGAKHDTLNRAAYSIGGLVAAGQVIEGVAFAALSDALSAIRHRCEDYPAAQRTLQQAFRDGMAAPRQPPPPRHSPDASANGTRTTSREHAANPGTPGDGEAYDPETGEVLPRAAKPSPLVWFDDIRPILDTKDFVQGLLVEESAAVVYGESNAGKTFWTTDLALHVAAGMEWNGRRVEQGGVIYCVLEGGFGFQNRVSAWRDAHAPKGPVYFAARQASLNMLDPDADTPRLIQTIQDAAAQIAVPIKLIIIDTLARAFAGGNENASEDMGALVLNMTAIQRATGACVLFVHHSGKDQAKGARGHSSLRAALDTEIEVVANEETGLKTATSVKQREMKKGEAFHFTLPVIELGKNRHGEPVTTCIVQPASTELVEQAKEEASNTLTGDKAAALRVLTDLLAEPGRATTGAPGTPPGAQSVPAEWWRDRFYSRAKPGAAQAAKQKAFVRAGRELVEMGRVCMDNNRVWLP